MVILITTERKLHIVKKKIKQKNTFAYGFHDVLLGGRVVVLVCWCRRVFPVTAHCLTRSHPAAARNSASKRMSESCLRCG